MDVHAHGKATHVGPLACPRCRGALIERAEAMLCAGCAAAFPRRGGIVDFAPQLDRQAGLAQRFMESDVVASVYERAFRPAFTWLGSPIRYADEDRYLTGHVRPVDGPLLDVACGTGRYTRWLARGYEGRQVVGLDLSFAMLRRAVRAPGTRRCTFVRASALSLPLADATFGAVNCFAALHLFPDPERAIQEIGRVLRGGGTFTGLTACAAGAGRMVGRVRDAFSSAAKFRFFDPEELRRMLERARMSPVDFSFHGSVVLFSACAGAVPAP